MKPAMHDELIAAIADWNPAHRALVRQDTALISSARLDSLGLLRLLMWIEGKIGRSIDASAVDMVKEWDSVDSIVRYVERERGGE